MQEQEHEVRSVTKTEFLSELNQLITEIEADTYSNVMLQSYTAITSIEVSPGIFSTKRVGKHINILLSFKDFQD